MKKKEKHLPPISVTLLLQAQAGDVQAISKVVERGMPIIKGLAGKQNNREYYEDFIGEGVRGLLECLRTFDVRRQSAQFLSFAYWGIRAYILILRDKLKEFHTFDPTLVDVASSLSIPDPDSENNPNLIQDVLDLVSHLPSKERFLIQQLYLREKSLDSVVREYNRHCSSRSEYVTKKELSDLKKIVLEKLRRDLDNTSN